MDNDKLNNQISKVNIAFHRLWFGLLFGRPDLLSDKFGGLSFIDLSVISIADHHPDMIMKEIRDYLKIPQTTLSSIVGKLEKRGFIKRIINRRDMRSFSLKITKKGKEIMEEHKRIDNEQAKRIVLTLDGHERDKFVELLEKVGLKI